MRKTLLGIAAAAAIAFTTVAHAELQNVTIDGSIQIRANYYGNMERGPLVRDFQGNVVRPTGAETEHVEQRTRLGVNAEFTDQVSSYIELDNYYWWDGQESDLSVDIHQAYVQAEEMWNTPLRMRIGRQELKFGSSWLVGANESAPGFTGLSFDAIRATYATDQISVDAFASEMFDNSTFSGVYGSYIGQPDMTFDAYWLWDRNSPRYVDELDTHTFGLRGAGDVEGLDFEGEVAFQTGDAPRAPRLRDEDYWAANAEVGYTFDTPNNPRIFLGGAWFDGQDTYKPTIFERLNPFHTPAVITSFNRLYSDVYYSEFFGRDLNNVIVGRGGASIQPTEETEVELLVSYLRNDEVPSGVDEELGWEVGLYGTYNYTEDLQFSAGWAHLFAESGVEWRGDTTIEDDEDPDYVFVETRLSF
ncbi:MAG: alginate export family protein [Candidatus Hydrogenedentota bacterium]